MDRPMLVRSRTLHALLQCAVPRVNTLLCLSDCLVTPAGISSNTRSGPTILAFV